MPIDYSNPSKLRFFTEIIEKENERRMIWFNKNKEKLIRRNAFPDNHNIIQVEDVQKAYLTAYLPSFSKNYHVNKANHRKRIQFDNELTTLKYRDLVEEPKMSPVEENVKGILYEDLPFGGCREYLKARNLKKPEDKYYFCETSSNVIGWRLKDSYVLPQAPKYGLFSPLTRSVISRTGPQPDPSYYEKPYTGTYSKCFSVWNL